MKLANHDNDEGQPEEVVHWSLTTLREKLIMIARADVLGCAWTAILGTKPSDDAAHPSCRDEGRLDARLCALKCPRPYGGSPV